MICQVSVSELGPVYCFETSYVTRHVAWAPRDDYITFDDFRITHSFEDLTLLLFELLVNEVEKLGLIFSIVLEADVAETLINIEVFRLLLIFSFLVVETAILVPYDHFFYNLTDHRVLLLVLEVKVTALDLNKDFVRCQCPCIIDHSKQVCRVGQTDPPLPLDLLIVGYLEAVDDSA